MKRFIANTAIMKIINFLIYIDKIINLDLINYYIEVFWVCLLCCDISLWEKIFKFMYFL